MVEFASRARNHAFQSASGSPAGGNKGHTDRPAVSLEVSIRLRLTSRRKRARRNRSPDRAATFQSASGSPAGGNWAVRT